MGRELLSAVKLFQEVCDVMGGLGSDAAASLVLQESVVELITDAANVNDIVLVR